MNYIAMQYQATLTWWSNLHLGFTEIADSFVAGIPSGLILLLLILLAVGVWGSTKHNKHLRNTVTELKAAIKSVEELDRAKERK
ncbi:TMhelix containing protein [Vibrio phage 1.253.O._10N.286.45.B12]|nr:TMhelix containing protein [Vibrio phage 1.235.O._10N.261.52.B2]AUR98566.1 TMhelix containing protein [Vibrio phage 1.253.O._10N.286.45.B12]